MIESELPYEAWIVALLTLPKMGPSRLSSLLSEHDAETAWNHLCTGKPLTVDQVKSDTVARWREVARNMSVVDHWQAIRGLGISVAELGADGYPERLRHDIEPPHIMFGLGNPLGDGPTVGIVGTRQCSSYGQRCAFELGAGLAEAGVHVVSGLALGIDAAAHQGALTATSPTRGHPIGVVGSGLDIVYPRRNAALWARVGTEGALYSETAPGVQPAPWRFPARNRIIAGLSDAVVVIESHERGGSLLTVDEAQLRDVPVGAVPGPITSKAAAGTNRLLVDGATPVLGVDDIFSMIGYSPPTRIEESNDDDVRSSALLDVLGWTPKSLEQICGSTTLPAAEVAAELERLVIVGVVRRSGPWHERVR